jgi:hypothetical protein
MELIFLNATYRKKKGAKISLLLSSDVNNRRYGQRCVIEIFV